MPFSVLRGGDQCDEVTDGGDVIGKAAGFSSAMAVKCAIKVEMETSWAVNACISMDPFLYLLNVQCCPHPRYFSTKFFAASISHNHFPQNILLPSPCLTSAPPPHPPISAKFSQPPQITITLHKSVCCRHPAISVKTLFLHPLLLTHPCSENSFVQGVHCN